MSEKMSKSEDPGKPGEGVSTSGSPPCSADVRSTGYVTESRIDPLKPYRSSIAHAEREAGQLAGDVQVLKALSLRASDREVIAIGNIFRKLFG